MATITVQSPSIKPDGTIPTRYTKDGGNVSPTLEWSGTPADAKSIVVMVEDPDAPGPPTPFIHWLVYGLPPDSTSLPEGVPAKGGPTLPAGAAQGQNSFKSMGYGGPSPPPGKPHHYHFIVAALDEKIALRPGATRDEVHAAIRGHILAQGELIGTYGR